MTIKELVEQLKEFPEDAVVVSPLFGECNDVYLINNNEVIIE